VRGYCPADAANRGHGVLVEYELRRDCGEIDRELGTSADSGAAADAALPPADDEAAAEVGAPPPPPLSEAGCRELVRQAVAALGYEAAPRDGARAAPPPPGDSAPAAAAADAGGARSGSRFGGRTALHWAARHGHLAVCAWLVARGADVDAQTSDGTPPLHWAVWQGRLAVCRWLVDEAGASLHALNAFGCTAAGRNMPSRRSLRSLEACRGLSSRASAAPKI
jgi:hypothetical protein